MMFRTSPSTNWSQVFEEIASLLIIMSHKEWDSGEDGMGEKGGRSQMSVTPTPIMFHLQVHLALAPDNHRNAMQHPPLSHPGIFPTHILKLLHLAQVGMSIDLTESKVLPM